MKINDSRTIRGQVVEGTSGNPLPLGTIELWPVGDDEAALASTKADYRGAFEIEIEEHTPAAYFVVRYHGVEVKSTRDALHWTLDSGDSPRSFAWERDGSLATLRTTLSMSLGWLVLMWSPESSG